MSNILNEIALKAESNVNEWGVESDDTHNDPFVWMGIIIKTSSNWMVGEHIPLTSETVERFRQAMIDTAATALSAIESLDRQRNASGTTFYEKKIKK